MSLTMRPTRGSILWTVFRLKATSGSSGVLVARSPLELFMVLPPLRKRFEVVNPLSTSYVGFQVGAPQAKQVLWQRARRNLHYPGSSHSLGQRSEFANLEKSVTQRSK